MPTHLHAHCLVLGVGSAVRQPDVVLCPDQFADVYHSRRGLNPKANLARVLGIRGILGRRHVTRSGRADSARDTFFGVLLRVSLKCVWFPSRLTSYLPYSVLYYDNSESVCHIYLMDLCSKRMGDRSPLPLVYVYQQYVGITGKHGIEPQPTRNDGRKLSSSETGGSKSIRVSVTYWTEVNDSRSHHAVISAVVIVVVFGLLACYYRQRNTPAGWYHRAMRRQHRMAVNQAKMVNPLVPTPHLLVGPPPIPDPPRDRIYSKPFWKGLANRNRAGAMALDPHTTVTQQQQRQQLLPEQQQATLEARQDSSPHHRHHRSQHHRHHDNYPENQQPGFFGRFRRLFRGSAPEERAEYHSSRHHHDLQHHRHVRHASELTRTNPAHSRPQSSSSRHHRDTRRRSFDEGAHSFSGLDGEASFHQSHPNGHGSQPTYGLAHDQWGHQAPVPVADQLFFDTTRHPQHMGGPMIYNEPHEAYEHRYMPPYGPIPQQQPSGYFQRLFH